MNWNARINKLIYDYKNVDTHIYIESYINGYSFYEAEEKTVGVKKGIIGRLIEAISKLCKKVIETIKGVVDKIVSTFKGVIQVPKSSIEETKQIKQYANDLKALKGGGKKPGAIKEWLKKHKKLVVGAAVVGGAAIATGAVLSGRKAPEPTASEPKETLQFSKPYRYVNANLPKRDPNKLYPPKGPVKTTDLVTLTPPQFKKMNDDRAEAVKDIKDTVEVIFPTRETEFGGYNTRYRDDVLDGGVNSKPKGDIIDVEWREVQDDTVELLNDVQEKVNLIEMSSKKYELIPVQKGELVPTGRG